MPCTHACERARLPTPTPTPTASGSRPSVRRTFSGWLMPGRSLISSGKSIANALFVVCLYLILMALVVTFLSTSCLVYSVPGNQFRHSSWSGQSTPNLRVHRRAYYARVMAPESGQNAAMYSNAPLTTSACVMTKESNIRQPEDGCRHIQVHKCTYIAMILLHLPLLLTREPSTILSKRHGLGGKRSALIHDGKQTAAFKWPL